jgi:hypothetical protein
VIRYEIGRNLTDEFDGALGNKAVLLIDRDALNRKSSGGLFADGALDLNVFPADGSNDFCAVIFVAVSPGTLAV